MPTDRRPDEAAPAPRPRGIGRPLAALLVVVALVPGYAALDAADVVPGVLTAKPAPPPPPTETPGTRTLPVVPQPTVTTSVGAPLPALAGAGAAATAAGVARALSDVRALPALADAALVVRDGQTGAVLLDQGGAELRIPASTTKLLSAAAIGQGFTPDATLQTVVRQGDTPGQIVLVAGGDSLLAPGKGDPEAVAGHAGLADLADQVAAALDTAGTRTVALALDESYAYGPPLAPTWSASFRPSGITGAVAMLGLSSERAEGGRPGPADPVASVRDAFARLLRSRGIEVTLAARTTPTPTSAAGAPTAAPTPAPTPAPAPATATGPGAVLGRVVSAPVRDQLALALTDSDNALTEILARQASFRSGGGTTFAETGAWVVSQVAALGLPTTGVVLRDASGLSRENRVPADLLSRILVLGYDGKHSVLRRALDGLPISGLTGTLEDRFTGSATSDAAGRARAKTGTLTGANALAGSVVDDDGRLLVFAGMVAGAGTLDARAALDRFVATLASCGCR